MPVEEEFEVSKHITLKLESGVTYIYINGVRSKRTIGLFVNLPQDNYKMPNDIELIDDAVEGLESYSDIYLIDDYYVTRPRGREQYNITPEQEFWAHCSNLQVWVENDYDMSLIHSKLGFNLLKSLTNHGIQPAKERYKQEIINRFRMGHIESAYYLLSQKFHRRFSKQERAQLMLEQNPILVKNITTYLADFNPISSGDTLKRPAIDLLEELHYLGDKEAKIILNNYRTRISARKTVILDVEDFWDIIQNTYIASKGSPMDQENLLIEELKTRSIDEIWMFSDYLSYFTNKLDTDSLLNALLREFNLYISDDVWYYRRGHIVILGRDAYESALYKPHQFVDVLKTRVYGEPENIRYEFWGVASDAFRMKTGLSSDHLDYCTSAMLPEEVKTIFKRLEKEYEAIIATIQEETEFKINKNLTVKLEDEQTIIYIAGKRFMQCKYLLLEIPVSETPYLEDIDSIDDASERLGWTYEGQIGVDGDDNRISPETEFWGHCSNLQAWAENDYNTKLLHRNLAFPLLRELADAGDPTAKDIFKEEVAQRFESGNSNVCNYLINTDYLNYLPEHYLYDLIRDTSFLQKLALTNFPHLESFIHKYLTIKQKDRFFDFNEVYEIYKEIYVNDVTYPFERYLFLELLKDNFKNLKVKNLTFDQVRSFFEMIPKFRTVYDIDIAFNKSIIIPFVLSCLNDTNPIIKNTFLVEFALRLNYNHDKNVFGIDLMQAFIEGCERPTLHTLIKDPESGLFNLLYIIFEMISYPYGNLEWEEWRWLGYKFEFWHEEFLKIVGNSLSYPLKERIKHIITHNETKDVLFLLYLGLFDKLDMEDLVELITDANYKLLDVIFDVLGKENELIGLIEMGLFSPQFVAKCSNNLEPKIIEISTTNLKLFVQCKLIDYLEHNDLSQLLHQNKGFLEDVISFAQSEEWVGDDDYDIEWPYKLFKRFQNHIPRIYNKEISQVIQTTNEAMLLQFIREDALYSLESDELITLLETSGIELTKKFLVMLHHGEAITNESLVDLEWFFEWFFTQFSSIQKSREVKLIITKLLETNEKDIFHGIFKSRWLEYFSLTELQSLVHNPKISLLERIIEWLELYYKDDFLTSRVIGVCYLLDQDETKDYIIKILNALSKDILDQIPGTLLNILYNPRETREIKTYTYELVIKYMDKIFSKKLEYVLYNGEKFFEHNGKLIINNRDLTDISKIRGLPNLVNLRHLDLSYNSIDKIRGLDTLVNLEFLNLRSNKITEISGLSELTKLKELNLDGNRISEIKGLENLESLAKLSITRNNIPHNVIRDLGGTTFFYVYLPQKFVKYCKDPSKYEVKNY